MDPNNPLEENDNSLSRNDDEMEGLQSESPMSEESPRDPYDVLIDDWIEKLKSRK